MGTFYYEEMSYQMHCKEHLLSLMKEQNLEPVLIVIGGSRARRCFNERSDVDIFAHHLGKSIVGFDNTPELRKIFGVRDSVCIQFSSEGMNTTLDHIFGRHSSSTTASRLDRIENFMCFDILYETSFTKSIKDQIQRIGLDEIGKWYRDVSLLLNKEYMSNDVIVDKIALAIIRTGLTSLWIEEFNTLVTDTPMLTKWANIDVDWLEIYKGKNRYRNPTYWSHEIQTVVEMLK